MQCRHQHSYGHLYWKESALKSSTRRRQPRTNYNGISSIAPTHICALRNAPYSLVDVNYPQCHLRAYSFGYAHSQSLAQFTTNTTNNSKLPHDQILLLQLYGRYTAPAIIYSLCLSVSTPPSSSLLLLMRSDSDSREFRRCQPPSRWVPTNIFSLILGAQF
jgi:hypothetical protein